LHTYVKPYQFEQRQRVRLPPLQYTWLIRALTPEVACEPDIYTVINFEHTPLTILEVYAILF
jgi:hypothetical protein